MRPAVIVKLIVAMAAGGIIGWHWHTDTSLLVAVSSLIGVAAILLPDHWFWGAR